MEKIKKGVRLEHISKIYKDPKTGKDFYAVKDTDLEIKPGSFVTLLGPSGCGKTTTLRMIAGFESPDEGEIYLGDEPINELTPNKRDTAMVFQSYALLPHYNIFDNVAYGLKLRKLPKDVIKEKVMKILELVKLSGMEGRMTNQLSGGQQQRVALARALVIEPSVLLFDEPLSNLDAKLRVEMRTEIRRIQQEVGITAVYVTHDQSEAMAISDQIIIMDKGVVAQMGTPEEIYYHPVSEFVADFIGEANFLRGKYVGNNGKYAVLDFEGNKLKTPPKDNMKVGEQYTAVLRPEAAKLGDKVMGEITEYVSQFEVSDDYTQISYKNSVYRVTPLEYASFFKYLTNSKNGIPAYITVNSTNGKTDIVKLKDLGLDGMKYVPSAILNQNLNRKLQLSYPTSIFGSPSFEVDEKGHPWYVCTTYTYFGVGNKKKVTGAVLFDPITGKSKKYDKGKVPKWVDRVYPEELIMTEIDENGSLQDGFFNSVLVQKNVTVTSEGYNYLEKDGDIWIYSGITSANKDSSNLGFVLSNLRTHQTLRFSCSGANEKAAMKSAEGEVKNYGYDATFPLLVNVGGHPVYLISLKDSGGLIKQYAMVDAKDYQKVSVYSADSVKNLELLKKSFLSSQTITEESDAETKKKDITIANVQILNVDGKSKLFIVDTEGNKYKAVITSENENTLAFLKTGETIHIRYIEMKDVNIIKNVGE